jgi:hypothetical protein
MTTADESQALGILCERRPDVWEQVLAARSWERQTPEIKKEAAEIFQKWYGRPMNSDLEDE